MKTADLTVGEQYAATLSGRIVCVTVREIGSIWQPGGNIRVSFGECGSAYVYANNILHPWLVEEQLSKDNRAFQEGVKSLRKTCPSQGLKVRCSVQEARPRNSAKISMTFAPEGLGLITALLSREVEPEGIDLLDALDD